jgi:hypothetical protein
MIAAGSGYTVALEQIKHMFTDGYATKEDYAKALYGHIKQTWLRSKVLREMKLLHLMTDTNIIKPMGSCNIGR